MTEREPAVPEVTWAWRALLGLLVICLGTIAAPLDSAVNIAFPSITNNFDLKVQDIRWVAIAYVLTYASLLLVFGRLGDLIGHRIVFQVGLLTSAIGFAGCAFASMFEMLLAARVLQGIGVALMLSCAPALALSLYGEQKRTRVLGVYAAMMALGGVVGPLAGGVLVEHFGWPVVFWARMPLVLSALALSGVIPPRRSEVETELLDPIGSAQLAFAVCAILGGVSMLVDARTPLAAPALVGLGSLSLVLFVRRQLHHATPIIRLSLFRDPAFSLVNAASVIANLAAFSVVLIGPFYLVGIARLETGLAGVVLALAAVGAIIGSALAPRVIARLGGVRTACVGMGLSSAGLCAIAWWSAGTSVHLMTATLLLQGVGLGLFQVAYADIVTAALPVAERGVAGSLTMLTRSIGIAGGAAGLSTVHQYFAAAHAAGGGSAPEAFMAGFSAVFASASALQLAALVAGAVLAGLARRQHGSAGKRS